MSNMIIEPNMIARRLLTKKNSDWKAISERSGVSLRWIQYFVKGKIKNPGYETLKRIREAL